MEKQPWFNFFDRNKVHLIWKDSDCGMQIRRSGGKNKMTKTTKGDPEDE